MTLRTFWLVVCVLLLMALAAAVCYAEPAEGPDAGMLVFDAEIQPAAIAVYITETNIVMDDVCRWALSANGKQILCVRMDGAREIAPDATTQDFAAWAIEFLEIYRRDVDRLMRAADLRDSYMARSNRYMHENLRLRALCGERCRGR